MPLTVAWCIYATLMRIPAQCRAMPPGKAWLILIPGFDLYWRFVVVRRMTASLKSACPAASAADMSFDDGSGVGMAGCVLNLFIWIGFLGLPMLSVIGLVVGACVWAVYCRRVWNVLRTV
jgi:hypothetical protein